MNKPLLLFISLLLLFQQFTFACPIDENTGLHKATYQESKPGTPANGKRSIPVDIPGNQNADTEEETRECDEDVINHTVIHSTPVPHKASRHLISVFTLKDIHHGRIPTPPPEFP